MGRDLWMSVGLHVTVIAVLSAGSLFGFSKDHDWGEVIRVTAVSMPKGLTPQPVPAQPEPVPVVKPRTPEPVADEDVEIPVDDPESRPEEKVIPPKEEPKQAESKPEKPKASGQTATSPPSGDAEESPDIAEAQGSPFAGATVDNSAFDYPPWFNQAFRKLGANFRHNVQTDARLVCIVYFQVIQSGRVTGLEVVESSGYQVFDDACLEAVSRSAPFPPLPRSYRDEIIGITIPFSNR